MITQMHKALVDGHVVGLFEFTELIHEQLKQSITVCLVQNDCHRQLVDIWKDIRWSTGFDRVLDNIQSVCLQRDSNSLEQNANVVR